MSRSQDWVKAHTRDLNDARYLRLTWAQRGILDAAMRYSKAHSTVPGYFVRDDKPLSVADIALGIGASSAGDQRTVADAFAAFVREELMHHTAASGYDVIGWDEAQSGTATEGREAWRRRKQKQRRNERDAKKRAQLARARAAAGASNIIDLPRRPEGER